MFEDDSNSILIRDSHVQSIIYGVGSIANGLVLKHSHHADKFASSQAGRLPFLSTTEY